MGFFCKTKIAFIFNEIKTAPSHLRSPVQNTETGITSLVYHAEIIMAVPSDHPSGDKRGHVSS